MIDATEDGCPLPRGGRLPQQSCSGIIGFEASEHLS